MACARKKGPPAFEDPYAVREFKPAKMPATTLALELLPGRGNTNFGVEWGKANWPREPTTKNTVVLEGLCPGQERWDRAIPLTIITLAFGDDGVGAFVGRTLTPLHPDYKHVNMSRPDAYKFLEHRFPRLMHTLHHLNGTENFGLVRDIMALSLMFKKGGVYLDNARVPKIKSSLDCIIGMNDTFMVLSEKQSALRKRRLPNSAMLGSFASTPGNARIAGALTRIVEFVNGEVRGDRNMTVDARVTQAFREQFHATLFE
jgi:hypothetical protein